MPETVVIIGAGFAGLAAARTIRSQDNEHHRIIVLEGGQTVGGRANTQDVQGLGRVEFGATYFHGLEGHPLYDAACQSGLMDAVHSKGQSTATSDLLVVPLLLASVVVGVQLGCSVQAAQPSCFMCMYGMSYINPANCLG